MTVAIQQQTGNGWSLVQGDCVEVVKTIPDASIDLTVYSPPFASLYTYSNSDRDMGNCKTHDEFHEHFRFLLGDLLRVTKKGRNMCVHAMDLPTSKTRDGFIGLSDFPGAIISSAQDAGWIWHSRVVIWKDPVTAMQRTKALGLLHKQILKDSCMSRQGIPDYVLTFRKPGENPEPVRHRKPGQDPNGYEEFPVEQWQRWASPIWDDIDPSDTLQFRSARENDDERHVCPLQLEVIRRCVRLWSNPADTVLSPFAGIGSEGHVALEEGRRFVGVELKTSYFEQAARNLAASEPKARGKQVTLWDMAGGAK